MKNIIFLFCFSFISNIVPCQISGYAASPFGTKSSITINSCKNEFILYFYALYSSHNLKGKQNFSNNIYRCKINFFQEIQLKQIDKYRLLVLNNNFFFKKNTLLYCYGISDCKNNRIEDSMFWENGLREGCWHHYTEKGIISKIWKKGKKIKEYFKTYKEIEEASAKLPKM